MFTQVTHAKELLVSITQVLLALSFGLVVNYSLVVEMVEWSLPILLLLNKKKLSILEFCQEQSIASIMKNLWLD